MTARRLLAAGLLAASLAVPAPAPAKPYCERLYDAARRDYLALLENERRQRFRDSWEAVAAKFAQITDKYPDCSKAPDALFNTGALYRKLYRVSWIKEDLNRSLSAYQAVAKRYPRSTLADDALLSAGEVLVELGDKREAYRQFAEVVRAYPRGDMAARAKGRLEDLSVHAPRPAAAPPAARPRTERATVTDLRHWSNPDYTRVVVYLTGPAEWKLNQLKGDPSAGKPPRLYVDIRGAAIPPSLCNPIPISDGLLLQARIGQNDPDTVRLVLDIDSMKDHSAFAMENPSRLVIDVRGEGRAQARPPAAPSPPSGSGGEPLPLAQQLGLGVRKVVLDPGHGGRDPGAVGPNGLREKDVTLALALRIKPRLEEKGFQVLLTRDTDTFVELQERTAFANKQQADLFISIHTNASRNRQARGVETYFQGSARDRGSSETAQLENAINEQTLADLEKILLDLVRVTNLKESSVLAESIQDSLHGTLAGRYGSVRNNGVKQAAFYVLMGAQMPSVLVETSFISHATEEKLLANREYRDLVADAIAQGVFGYVDRLGADRQAAVRSP